MQEKTSKNVSITEKKENNMSKKSYIQTKIIYIQQPPLVLTGTDEWIFQYNVPIVGNTSLDDCKQMKNETNNR